MDCEKAERKISPLAAAKGAVRQVYLDAYRQGWRPGERSQINVGAELATVLEEFPREVLDELTSINGNNQSELARIRDEIIKEIKSGTMEMELMSG